MLLIRAGLLTAPAGYGITAACFKTRRWSCARTAAIRQHFSMPATWQANDKIMKCGHQCHGVVHYVHIQYVGSCSSLEHLWQRELFSCCHIIYEMGDIFGCYCYPVTGFLRCPGTRSVSVINSCSSFVDDILLGNLTIIIPASITIPRRNNQNFCPSWIVHLLPPLPPLLFFVYLLPFLHWLPGAE